MRMLDTWFQLGNFSADRTSYGLHGKDRVYAMVVEGEAEILGQTLDGGMPSGSGRRKAWTSSLRDCELLLIAVRCVGDAGESKLASASGVCR